MYLVKPVDYGQFSEAIRNLGLSLNRQGPRSGAEQGHPGGASIGISVKESGKGYAFFSEV